MSLALLRAFVLWAHYNFTFTFHFHALEKEMATHSSVLAWRIPGTGEPGGLPSMGSHRVGSDWGAQETEVRSLALEDPLEKEVATHSSSLAWKIPWTEEPGRLLEPPERPQGSPASSSVWREDPGLLSRPCI